MKTISKKGEGQYWDKDSAKPLNEEQLLDYIKTDVSFRIVHEDDGTDITDAELAQILIHRAKKKTEGERILDSVKNLFESGRNSATQVLQDMAFASYGLLATTEKKTRELIDQLIVNGKVSKEKGEELFNKAKENLLEQEKQFEIKAKNAVQKHLTDLGIATPNDLEKKIQKTATETAALLNKDLQEMKKKIDKLTQKLEQLSK